MPSPRLLLTLLAVLPFSPDVLAAQSSPDLRTPVVTGASTVSPANPLMPGRLAQTRKPPAAADDDQDDDQDGAQPQDQDEAQPQDQNQDQGQDDDDDDQDQSGKDGSDKD